VFPPDSSRLFQDGILNEHNFAESSFAEEQAGTDVSEFNLTNADASNVKNMANMFEGAESFNQDISDWDTSNVKTMVGMFADAESFNQDISAGCVEDISREPLFFDNMAGFEDDNTKQTNWGEPC